MQEHPIKEETTGSIELRVLAGLQAGARLTLAEGRHVLGSSELCDIVLVGPGVEPQALVIVVEGAQLHLQPSQPECGVSHGDSLSEPFVLASGIPFHIGDIWLVADHEDSPWPENRSWLVQAQPSVASHAVASGEAHEVGQIKRLSSEPGQADTPSHRRLWLIWGGASIAVFCLAGLGALIWIKFSRNNFDNMQILSAASLLVPRLSPAAGLTAEPTNMGSGASHVANPSLAAVDPQDAGSKKRAGPELLLLEPGADAIPAGPPLGIPLINTHHAMGRVRDASERPEPSTVSSTELTRLPFMVRQVTCGSVSSVTTDKGVKFFEGASHMGYELLSISANRLKLRGRHDVDLPC